MEHGYAFAEGFTASRLSEAIGELILRKRLTGARPPRPPDRTLSINRLIRRTYPLPEEARRKG